MQIGGDEYQVRLVLEEDFRDLHRWVRLDDFGRWTVDGTGLVGEWLEKSPSIFLKEKIHGPYLWQIRVTRLAPNDAFLKRFQDSKWGQGHDPLHMYNFNFWLRADDPEGGDFFERYPEKLGTGWNGMGDDYWNSFYTTVVWGTENNYVRLRRGPGYEMVQDVHDTVPHLAYDEPHLFTFVLFEGRVRMYFDQQLVYDHEEASMYEAGYIGLCVWLATIRFEEMRIYRFV